MPTLWITQAAGTPPKELLKVIWRNADFTSNWISEQRYKITGVTVRHGLHRATQCLADIEVGVGFAFWWRSASASRFRAGSLLFPP